MLLASLVFILFVLVAYRARSASRWTVGHENHRTFWQSGRHLSGTRGWEIESDVDSGEPQL